MPRLRPYGEPRVRRASRVGASRWASGSSLRRPWPRSQPSPGDFQPLPASLSSSAPPLLQQRLSDLTRASVLLLSVSAPSRPPAPSRAMSGAAEHTALRTVGWSDGGGGGLRGPGSAEPNTEHCACTLSASLFPSSVLCTTSCKTDAGSCLQSEERWSTLASPPDLL